MPEESDPPPPPSGKPRRYAGSAFAGETTGGQGTEANDSRTQPRRSWDENTLGQDSVIEPAASHSSHPRQVIDDFEILGKLGQGGMGWVYRARQMSLDRQVALKILPSHFEHDPIFVARFVREARVAGNLQHPNLVKVFTSGVADDTHTHFIAMELVEGETLSDWVKRGALPLLDALRITLDVARALEYGWRTAQLIHRDVKPGNIFLSQDGQVKLGDLGLAKTMDGETSTGLTQTGKAMGTPHYISPEQARGEKDIDFRADIYSLGCTLFQMLTGQTPYHGSDALVVMGLHRDAPPPAILKVMPGLPVPLARLVSKMLKKSRRERFGSYEELIAQIESVQAQLDPALMAAIKAAAAQSGGGFQPPIQSGEAAGMPLPQGGRRSAPSLLRKSKLPLYAGIAAGLLVLAIVGYLLWPKETLTKAQIYAHDHAAELAAKAKAQADTKALAAALDGASKDAPFENTLGMKFVPVPIIGGPTSGHRVLFSIWDTRVQDYEAFVKESNREWPTPDFEQGPTHPAVNVSWDDAQAFCQWLTSKERLAGKLPQDWSYRLPSDHEWSCAVGIGTREDAAKLPSEKSEEINDAFPWGSEWPPPEKAGNYWSEELRPLLTAGKYSWVKGELAGRSDGYATTSPVGSFPANRFGLFDMGGDVWQWCEDWFDKEQNARVLRGASWGYGDRSHLLSSNRNHNAPGSRFINYGFRCVLAVASPAPAPAPDNEGRAASPRPPTNQGTLGESSLPLATKDAPGGAALDPGAIRLWDSPEKVTSNMHGASWEDGALRLDRCAAARIDPLARDAVLRARVRMNPDADGIRLSLRFQPKPDGSGETSYRLMVPHGAAEIVLKRSLNGEVVDLAKWPLERHYEATEWVLLELRAVGEQLTVSADGKVLGTIQDSSIRTPGGVLLYANAKGYFRDIEYVPLDKPAGTAKPALGHLSPSTEPWQDVLHDPAKGVLEGGAQRTPEGVRVTGYGTVTPSEDPKRDGAVRMTTTFGGLRPQLLARNMLARNTKYADHYQLYALDAKTITFNRWDSAARKSTTLRAFPLRESLQPGQDYELELRAVGQTFTAKLNGEVLGTAADATLSEGGFGVASIGGKDGDSVLIKALEVLDLDAPAGAPTAAVQWESFDFTKMDEVALSAGQNQKLTKEDGMLRLRDFNGWKKPGLQARNVALRATVHFEEHTAELRLAFRGIHTGDFPYARIWANTVEICTGETAQGKVLKGFGRPTPFKPGEEAVFQAAFIGNQMHVWVDGRWLGSADIGNNYDREGTAYIQAKSALVKSLDILVLDGLPEAEALHLLGQ